MVEETKPPKATVQGKHGLHGRRRIGLQIIIGAIILFSGIVAGSSGTILFLKDRIIWCDLRYGKRTPTAVAEEFRAKYDLTDEQTRQVEAIISKRKERVHAVWHKMDQKLETEQQALMAEMKKVLSPHQHEQWERDFKERMAHHRNRFGPPRHHPKSD